MFAAVSSYVLDDSLYFSPNFTVLNISTSAQLTFAMPADFKPPDAPEPASSISYFPYFDNSYLAVAASLNGGNVLATFVELLTAWMKELGMYGAWSSRWQCWSAGRQVQTKISQLLDGLS